MPSARQLRGAPFYSHPPGFALALRWAGLAAWGLLAAPTRLVATACSGPLPLHGTVPLGFYRDFSPVRAEQRHEELEPGPVAARSAPPGPGAGAGPCPATSEAESLRT